MKNALLDMAHGASNAAASTVAAPVDAIAWLLRKAGVNIPAPVGGSNWMAAQGLTKQPKNALAGIAGESLGMVSPMMAAAKAPQIANALLKAGDNLANTQRIPMSAQRGAIVWHGSPHKFDRFDSSKIGTGEGAQAYGHGLYLAESDRVAKQYADTLTEKAPRFLDGVPADKLPTAQKSALGMLADAGGNPNAALLAAKTDMARAGSAGADFHVERYNTLRDIARGKLAAQVGEPSLYKVDLPDEAIARMLNWDAPISQQTPAVQDAARLLGASGDLPGRALHNHVQLKAPGIDDGPLLPQAAQWLRRHGVPGIRYLDGGSRGAGQGTSNFVVFPGEESLLRILERNGIPITGR